MINGENFPEKALIKIVPNSTETKMKNRMSNGSQAPRTRSQTTAAAGAKTQPQTFGNKEKNSNTFSNNLISHS